MKIININKNQPSFSEQKSILFTTIYKRIILDEYGSFKRKAKFGKRNL